MIHKTIKQMTNVSKAEQDKAISSDLAKTKVLDLSP